MKTLKIGDKVPPFTLVDQNNNPYDFYAQAQRGKTIVYFYPKDESPVCTKEACSFRDSYTDFIEAGINVIGINSGSVAAHSAFAKANRLPFILLSDPGNAVLKLFGVKSFLMMSGRETFLIDRDGTILYSYRGFLAGAKHPEKMLEFIKSSKTEI
ncbi:MAG: peroxiredoxin [Chryseobacterium sp.]|nr:MAG: peroxiredoxin [Chryseobacterium sp.]